MYAGGEYLTGDEIAVALLEYGESLAEAGVAGMVEIPIIADEGQRVQATFLIGPASQIVATDAEAAGDELVDDVVVEQLRLLTRRLRPVAFPADEGAPYADEYE
jgi:hypothetical protein